MRTWDVYSSAHDDRLRPSADPAIILPLTVADPDAGIAIGGVVRSLRR
jgi:hypothetical protein